MFLIFDSAIRRITRVIRLRLPSHRLARGYYRTLKYVLAKSFYEKEKDIDRRVASISPRSLYSILEFILAAYYPYLSVSNPKDGSFFFFLSKVISVKCNRLGIEKKGSSSIRHRRTHPLTLFLSNSRYSRRKMLKNRDKESRRKKIGTRGGYLYAGESKYIDETNV